jgi:hypothetical protein
MPAVAKAAHLTQALRHAGVLGDARAREVVVETARPTILSQIIRLRLSYPDRIDTGWITDVATTMSARRVPRCFEAR